MTDAEQFRINRELDSRHDWRDEGRIIPRGSEEFEEIARPLLRREQRLRVLYA
jgi:hypothetical protein